MLGKKAKVIFAAVQCGISSIGLAVTFEYSKNVYQVSEAECHQQAQDLAAQIAVKTGGIAKSAYCKALPAQGFEIRTINDASEVPAVEVALYAFNVVNFPVSNDPINKKYSIISDQGTFGALADCMKALPSFEQQFTEQTGLSPMSTQCVQLPGIRYTPQVDAFGTGHRHLYELNMSLGRGTGSQAMNLDVINYLSSVGAWPLNQGTPSGYLHVKYFAESPINLGSSDLGGKNSFLTVEQCKTSETLVRRSLETIAETPLISLQCGAAESPHVTFPTTLVALFDTKSTDSDRANVSVRTYQLFGSFEDCNAKAQSTPKSYCAADIDIYGKLHGYSFNVFE